MRKKLITFTEFANSLYPHEIDYLISVQNFSEPDNIRILNLIHYNTRNPENTLPYDPIIDKRRYSYVKNWILCTLAEIDVDNYYDWLIGIEKQVMADSITPEEEKSLLENIHLIKPQHYYFIRFYELLQHYRDYLLVRNRTKYYKLVNYYLEAYHENYFNLIDLNHQINTTTVQIVNNSSFSPEELIQWENFLKEIYFENDFDGYTRYRAVVRLTILFYNNREFEKLRLIYEHLDTLFKTKVFYSKRILANYYANRAMMHSKLNEPELAEKYGYLSIRQKNSDYLFYLVNLCGVMLRQGKNKVALKIMSESIPFLKKTNSFYNKIGFVAFYVKTLMANNQNDKAVSYASTYFEGFKKEIFEHRWHLFFSTYLQALLSIEKYSEVISLSRRYKLVTKEKQFIGKAVYLPLILWYTSVSEYMEGKISQQKLEEIIFKSGQTLMDNKYKLRKIQELMNELSKNLPDVIKNIKEKLRSLRD